MKNKLIKLSYLAFAFSILTSCSADHYFKKGDDSYEHLRYVDAINYYEKGLEKKEAVLITEKLAHSYFYTNQIDQAKSKYETAINSGSNDPIVFMNYGKVLMSEGKYDEAIIQFKKYLTMIPNDVVVEMLLSSCLSINDRYRDTTLYELRPLELNEFSGVFSPIDYQSGIVFSGEKEVYRGSKQNPWTGNSYLDLFYMEKDDSGNWLSPILLNGEINGNFHEGPASFTEDGNTVYFTRSNYFKRKMVTNESQENNLKIFSATNENGKWVNLIELPFNSDDYSCGHPSVSADGKYLYFVSDMPGGIGGTDIYRCEWLDSVWSQPMNLGKEINTEGNELFPYLHSDGTLYFSSNAHNSMGGLDVFMTYYYNERWMTPENLNYPLNSSKDDFGYHLTGDNITGFISSSRTNKDEIYSFEKKPPVFNLYGTARKKGTDIPVQGVIVEITRDSDKKVISVQSDANGKFNIKLDLEENYYMYCTKIGCFTRTDRVSTQGLKYSTNFYADFEVEEIVIGKPIVLENIYYDFDKWDIREDAAKELDKLVKILIDNPNIHIQMGSHTDARGTDNYNMVLSDKRAKAAVDYLIMRGIDPSRLTWKGYGETEPLNHCTNGIECSDEEHQLNRRTEFRVLKM